ncbi:fatty acid desaturase domain-containing protein [Hirsutella rhossiliensis]|uniref:Fatty acid desaturase domain-containing protein n=1 Tax=Hirsutella rhossiliensis TaxID=111463 RepID=A0A9P8SIJ6_9HYPO|nr:fatty acid desaturase domain-containing protein [Hirsutella rhossiliensis]KAH0962690.1 fatty acid desaturase domain-containing protein [Hirsutella rhossiliensis]
MASTSSAVPSTAPRNAALRRTLTSTTVTDSESSAAVTPFDSPRPSASSTSLSSLSSNDASSKYAGLVDTYGNDFSPPNFTIKDIRDAIPKHCFERSALTGYSYILRDIVCLATTFVVFHNFVAPEYISSTPLRAALWGLYTVLQGLFATGLWVIAHECGHGAFSPSRLVNDVTGWVLHSALLVPYFSWQISHGKHHKATGHMERDMVFVPRTREQQASRVGRMVHELGELTEETPAYTLLMLVLQQLVGWPNYLLTNVTGHDYHERQREGRGKGKMNGLGGGVNHFDPRSPLYEQKDAKLIVLSDIGIGLAAAALVYLGNRFGWSNLAVWYFVPYLWVNHWLVAITFLQHTDPSLPHYTGDEWNFVRGAAATIDREMGFIGRHLLHGIIETHVLHHYVSSIPFYHADEASDAIRPIMGKHYRSDTEGGPLGFIRALWRSGRMCQWVEPSENAQGAAKGILFFRNRNGLGTKPLSTKFE